MQTEVNDELVPGTQLNIVACLKLTVLHVVFFHPHEGGIGIRFRVTVPVTQKELFFGIFNQLIRPMVFAIVQLL